jgi:hypothetical protein
MKEVRVQLVDVAQTGSCPGGDVEAVAVGELLALGRGVQRASWW